MFRALPMRLAVATTGLLFGSGCALTPVMPPLTSSYLQPGSLAGPPPSWRVTAPPPDPVEAESPKSLVPVPPKVEHDTAEGLTRVSVMTHRGSYFLWVQKPQVTFFYVYAGDAPPAEPPSVVYVVFRTQSPQSIRDNRLTLVCDGVAADVPGLPTSRVEQNYQLSTHFLTFTVPRETIVEFAHCQQAEVEVGGVRAPFTAQQLLNLRGLAAKLLGNPPRSS